MEDLVVNGLDMKPINYIAEKVWSRPRDLIQLIFKKISGLGFNCVRLVFALDTIFLDSVVKVRSYVILGSLITSCHFMNEP